MLEKIEGGKAFVDNRQKKPDKNNKNSIQMIRISLRNRRRNKLVHREGGRGFPADQRCPSQQQEQRDQGVGPHKKNKSCLLYTSRCV